MTNQEYKLIIEKIEEIMLVCLNVDIVDVIYAEDLLINLENLIKKIPENEISDVPEIPENLISRMKKASDNIEYFIYRYENGE